MKQLLLGLLFFPACILIIVFLGPIAMVLTALGYDIDKACNEASGFTDETEVAQ